MSLSSFLNTVPQPLTNALIRLAEPVRCARFVLQAASWSRPTFYDSWLLLAGWWVVCLFLPGVLVYALPLLLWLCAYLLPRRTQSPPVTTENSLQAVITDLLLIESLLPTLAHLPTLSARPRPYLILYFPYIVLTRYAPLHILVAVAGTVLLTHRAPWAVTLRTTLMKSAHIRFGIYKLVSFVSPPPLPLTTSSSSSLKFTPTQPSTPSASLRFLFTVYENQRWWMGLDWTAALIPAERPSWSTASLQPVSPPSSFSLPDDTTVVLPNPSKPGAYVKRTARWRWEEPEWKVLLRKETPENQNGVVARVERPLPIIKDELASPSTSTSTSRFAKLRESITSSSSSSSASNVTLMEIRDDKHLDKEKEKEKDHVKDTHGAQGDTEQEGINENSVNEPFTDVDGWVYGDNKWEGLSNKGGLGKYTRFRRWTRVAVVEETIEYLDHIDDHDQSVGTMVSPSHHEHSRMSSSSPSTSRERGRDGSSSTRREGSTDRAGAGGVTVTGTAPSSPKLVESAPTVALGLFTDRDSNPTSGLHSKTMAMGRSSAREDVGQTQTPLQQRLKALASRDSR
ncbi:hypothetical protein ONZ45_g9751 [Pleurotus djamor]|nr:hypothetical protein ONZ45_g9751 [Pleurotus djamor]